MYGRSRQLPEGDNYGDFPRSNTKVASLRLISFARASPSHARNKITAGGGGGGGGGGERRGSKRERDRESGEDSNNDDDANGDDRG